MSLSDCICTNWFIQTDGFGIRVMFGHGKENCNCLPVTLDNGLEDAILASSDCPALLTIIRKLTGNGPDTCTGRWGLWFYRKLS